MLIGILSITTFLVISVVKSSLALSLGLVGALSVIRFRTPIKEPEELSYLFLAIGIGHDVTRYYKKAIKITDVQELGDVMINQLTKLFSEKNYKTIH